MRGAVLDLGSHTFHAVVADVDTVGVRKVVFERKVTQPADPLCAIGDLIERTRPRAPDQFRIVATGVFRDDPEERAMLATARARFDARITVLDGHEEARLAWVGVSAELAGSHGRLAVVDLGGGSLQIAVGSETAELRHSVPLGALRLRGLAAAAVRQQVVAGTAAMLSEVRSRAPDTFAIASGTARALLAVARRLGMTSEIQRHLCTRTLVALERRLAPMSAAALAGLGVPVKRCETIVSGALALSTVLEQLGRPVVYVARSALREGVLVDLARARAASPMAQLARAS